MVAGPAGRRRDRARLRARRRSRRCRRSARTRASSRRRRPRRSRWTSARSRAASSCRTRTTSAPARDDWRVVTKVAPTPEQWRDLELAWRICGHVKSNAIVLVKDGQAVGIGAGQQNRVESGEIAAKKADGPRHGRRVRERRVLSVRGRHRGRGRGRRRGRDPTGRRRCATRRSSSGPTSSGSRWCSPANGTSSTDGRDAARRQRAPRRGQGRPARPHQAPRRAGRHARPRHDPRRRRSDQPRVRPAEARGLGRDRRASRSTPSSPRRSPRTSCTR